MLRYNQKTGDFSLSPSAIACLVGGVFAFGAWMTKMQYDVSGWHEVGTEVTKIQRVLLYNHLSVPPDFMGTQWPNEPLPFSPYWPALYSSQAVAARRALE